MFHGESRKVLMKHCILVSNLYIDIHVFTLYCYFYIKSLTLMKIQHSMEIFNLTLFKTNYLCVNVIGRIVMNLANTAIKEDLKLSWLLTHAKIAF